GLSVRYEGEGEYPELEVWGRAVPGVVELQSAIVQFEGYRAKGKANFTWDKNGSLLEHTTFTAQFQMTDEMPGSLMLDGSLMNSVLDTSLRIRNFALSNILSLNSPKIDGIIGMDISLKGSLQPGLKNVLDFFKTPGNSVMATIKLEKGSLDARPIHEATLSARIEKDVVWISEGRFFYDDYGLYDIAASLPLSGGRASIRANLAAYVFKQVLKAEFMMDSNLPDMHAAKLAEINPSVTGRFRNISFNGSLLEDIIFAGQPGKGTGVLAIDRAGLRSSLVVREFRNILLELNDFFGISARGSAVLGENSIDASVTLRQVDIASLAPLLQAAGIRKPAGRMQGNVTIQGSLADPKIDGQLSLKGVSFEADLAVINAVGPFDAEVQIVENQIQLPTTPVRIDGGTVIAYGHASIENWNIERAELQASTGDKGSVRLNGTIGGISTREIQATADLEMLLDSSRFLLRGDLLLDNGRLSINPSGFLESPAKTGALPLELDLSIKLGRNVTLFLPSEDIPLVRGAADPSSNLKVQYSELDGTLGVDGVVNLRSGYVLYLLRNFFIKECSILFSENETKFNPLITV
ncbi:MAG: hypothetical protein WHT81_09255, partial [Rectinemataceae bacterium]